MESAVDPDLADLRAEERKLTSVLRWTELVLLEPVIAPFAAVSPHQRVLEAPLAGREFLGHHDFDIDGYLVPDSVIAVDWGNLDYSETDFAKNRKSITDHV